MTRKQVVGPSALLVTAWATFALSYAFSPPTEGLLGLSVIIGVTFTCFAAMLIMRAWTEGESQRRASVAGVLATLVILLLAWLPNLATR